MSTPISALQRLQAVDKATLEKALNRTAEEYDLLDKSLTRTIDERDRLHNLFDSVCDTVLGIDRQEYSSAYGFEDAVVDVQERIAELKRQAAAAPDLLDALVSLAAVARRYLPDYDEHPEVQKADEAIAKSKGGAE